MTKNFDEWINENGFNFRPEQYDLYKYLYEAGQQSKQAEVDELRKRIDVLSKKLNEMAHIFLDDLDDILKGNSHES